MMCLVEQLPGRMLTLLQSRVPNANILVLTSCSFRPALQMSR
uniref:Alternative protein POLR3K n=1 Tax=Homo sapiens TaxID=9606 RepID=L0R6M6_HUMAN|nr:alternative protein POLR3K [Homo sapiens]